MEDMKTKFMKIAISLAVENIRSGKGGPFGAVIVKDGKVIARGANLVTSTNDPTAHAEIVAIREACRALDSFQLEGCDLYASCEPCPMCLGAIYWARPDRLYFAASKEDASTAGFDDSFIYKEIPKQIHERSIPTEQIKPNTTQSPFEAWNSKQDKVEY